jgi:hypothetical protein
LRASGSRQVKATEMNAVSPSRQCATPFTQSEARRQSDGRLAFLGLSAARCAAVEYSMLKVDPAAPLGRPQRGAADRAGTGAGVEADQDEPGDVVPDAASGPKQARGLVSGQPAGAGLAAVRKHDRRQAGA